MQGLGYFDAKVTVQKNPASADEMRVIYDIDAGDRHKLLKLAITGNKGFTEERFGRGCKSSPPAGFWRMAATASRCSMPTFVTSSQPVSRQRFSASENYDQGGRQLSRQAKRSGHYAADRRRPANDGRSLADRRQRNETGQSVSDLNISPGQAFGYSKVNEDRDIVLNYYFNNGFPDATFEVAAKPSASNPMLMDVTYTIHEGHQMIVDQVFTAGLNHTRPFIVQREIQVKPGDPLSQIDMLDTQKRLYDLGIFSQVDTAVQNPEAASGKRMCW